MSFSTRKDFSLISLMSSWLSPLKVLQSGRYLEKMYLNGRFFTGKTERLARP